MRKNVKVDFKELAEFQKRVEKLNSSMRQDFVEQCAKELAARLLEKVIKRTPVGKRMKKPEKMSEKVKGASGKSRSFLTAEGARYKEYWSGYQGGELKRAWTMRTIRSGKLFRTIVYNPKKYASYVEYGHRQTPGRFVPALGKRLKVAWVPGKLMMTTSAQELRSIAPALLRKWLEEELREAFK